MQFTNSKYDLLEKGKCDAVLALVPRISWISKKIQNRNDNENNKLQEEDRDKKDY